MRPPCPSCGARRSVSSDPQTNFKSKQPATTVHGGCMAVYVEMQFLLNCMRCSGTWQESERGRRRRHSLGPSHGRKTANPAVGDSAELHEVDVDQVDRYVVAIGVGDPSTTWGTADPDAGSEVGPTKGRAALGEC